MICKITLSNKLSFVYLRPILNLRHGIEQIEKKWKIKQKKIDMILTNNNSKVPRSTKNINVEFQEVKFCRRDQCEWANGIYGNKWVVALLNTFSFCLDGACSLHRIFATSCLEINPCSGGSRIFQMGGRCFVANGGAHILFSGKKCMKLKEIGLKWGGARLLAPCYSKITIFLWIILNSIMKTSYFTYLRIFWDILYKIIF